MKLFGSTTSPFVRRVRVVAAELGEPVDRIDTAAEAGQAALREEGIERIEDVDVCTYASTNHFSHRRDGVTGRQALFAWIES